MDTRCSFSSALQKTDCQNRRQNAPLHLATFSNRPKSTHRQHFPSSNTKEFCFRHGRSLRAAVLVFTVALLITEASAGVLSKKDSDGRKTFDAHKVRDMVQKALRFQKTSLWQRWQDKQAQDDWAQENGLPGVGGRARRQAPEENQGNVFSMEEEDRLGTMIGDVMACQNIPGLSLGVVRGGARQALGYGIADMETASLVDGDTLFGIGSNTKAFAAATLAHLMASGPFDKPLSWDTKLKDLLEDFRLADDMRTEQTTLEDVLSHRTGLGSADLGIFAGYPLNSTAEELCSRLRFLTELKPFRSTWHYSNSLYIIVSGVCQAVAGMDWAELARERIWQPLGMNDTEITPQAFSRDNVALPYILRMRVDDLFVQQDPELFNIHPFEAAGAIMSSAADMTRWLQYLLTVLKSYSLDDMMVAQIFEDRALLPDAYRNNIFLPKSIRNIGYGFGMMTSLYHGYNMYWHSGDFHGYSSYLVLVPEWNTAVYIASNGGGVGGAHSTLLRLAFYVLDLLHARAPWVNVTMICPKQTEGMEDYLNDYFHKDDDDSDDDNYIDNYGDDYHGDDTNTHANFKRMTMPIHHYTGVYGHGLLGDLTIVREEERNSPLRMHLGRLLVADLIPTDNSTIFKFVARAPLADTKEWESEKQLMFGDLQKSDDSPEVSTFNAISKEGGSQDSNTKLDSKNDDGQSPKSGHIKNGSVAYSSHQTTAGYVFHFLWFTWGGETYTFRRNVRFATAIEPEVDTETSTVGEGKRAAEEHMISGPAAVHGNDDCAGTASNMNLDKMAVALIWTALLRQV